MESHLTFRDYQRQAQRTDRVPKSSGDPQSILVPLLGLAGEAGSLLSEYKKWLRDGDRYRPFTDQVAEEIGDVLWYLANLAEKAGLDLQEIAEENLAKTGDRFHPGQGGGLALFGGDRYDAAYPEAEKLPLALVVEFRELEVEGKRKLETTINGRRFGDPLTDNSHLGDGYRYHDVFHFANAILLGWSPIVRRTMRLKRKSVPHVDEVEDGARAGVTEEAISAVVFGYAKDYSFFQGATAIDFGRLGTIKQMTAPFEVRDKGLREWEITILEGYKVWREMVANKGGVFVGDAKARSIRYEPLPARE